MPTDSQRTLALHIYTPIGKDYRIEVERETVRTYENKDTAPVGKSLIRRSMSQLAGKALPLEPVMIESYDDLAAVISACATAMAAEDEVAAALKEKARAESAAADAARRAAKPVIPEPTSFVQPAP